MNETNEGGWLFRLIIGIGIIGLLAIFVGCMVAPCLGPWIKRQLAIEYALYSDWERRVAADMPPIYAFLWFVAIVAWTIVFWCNL